MRVEHHLDIAAELLRRRPDPLLAEAAHPLVRGGQIIAIEHQNLERTALCFERIELRQIDARDRLLRLGRNEEAKRLLRSLFDHRCPRRRLTETERHLEQRELTKIRLARDDGCNGDEPCDVRRIAFTRSKRGDRDPQPNTDQPNAGHPGHLAKRSDGLSRAVYPCGESSRIAIVADRVSGPVVVEAQGRKPSASKGLREVAQAPMRTDGLVPKRIADHDAGPSAFRGAVKPSETGTFS